ncbi:hypothetical protein PHO31112_03270 [Pandoraea horticolens]|uniref:Uncharacterized protein n=1 Tax=Pandoraea horticolens TaxID=2508298 RepID=A0A5E4WI37_9BURK|nr:hypothetical protein PHO31112_03270 [Pandoraea horticolens]
MQLPELVRRQLPQGAMRTNRIVVDSPCFDTFAYVFKADKRVLV